MYKEIAKQISAGRYIEADYLISNALRKSFNMSIEKERCEFDNLQKFKNDIVQNIMLNNDKVGVDNFRSSAQVVKRDYNPQIYEEKFFEFVDSIEDNIVPQKRNANCDSTVNILLHPVKSDNNIFTALSEAGLYAEDPDYDCFEQIYLRGFNNNEYVDINKTIEGLNNIAAGLVEENMENVLIYFPIMYEDLSESALFLTLYAILYSTIMFTISTQVSENKKINIFWSFDDLQIEELFRKVISKAKIIKAQPQLIKSKFNTLRNETLTANENYLKQLKSISHIIDEVDVPILILGETGVGKSYLAEKIHSNSSRKGKFIYINCATITDTLAEAILFGTIAGRATDVKTTQGKIQQAERGTLFLDEVDRASKKVRDVLLTFIDTKKYSPVGGVEVEVPADVRLMYGSNKDFDILISDGDFEDDFLRRIDERIITIPPLRERTEDIESIVDFILSDLNKKKVSNINITSEVIRMIKKMPLKGNIREIEKIIKYGFYEVVHSDKFGVISLEHFEGYTFDKGILSSEFYNQIELARTFMLNYSIIKKQLAINDDEEFFMIEDFIMPIFAYLFKYDIYDKSDSKVDKKLSKQICGSSMDRGNDATIIKRSEKFQKIKKQF